MKTQSGCGTSPAHKFLSGSHQHWLWICQARYQVLLSPRYLHIVHWPNGHSCPRSLSLKKMGAGMENTRSGLNLMGASWKSKYRCLLKSLRVALISMLFQAWVSCALESVDYLTSFFTHTYIYIHKNIYKICYIITILNILNAIIVLLYMIILLI